MLADLGVPPAPPSPELAALAVAARLAWRGSPPRRRAPARWRTAPTPRRPLIETSADGVFCALQNQRLPARRHPLGIQMRIEELEAEEVIDDGGDLWHRRIEELEAAAAALCAHRYAVGHASWLGGPGRRHRPARLRPAGELRDRAAWCRRSSAYPSRGS